MPVRIKSDAIARPTFRCDCFSRKPVSAEYAVRTRNLHLFPIRRFSTKAEITTGRRSRTGVGHRRWVREDTPALTGQPEQRPPSLPARHCTFRPHASDLRIPHDFGPASLTPPNETGPAPALPFALQSRGFGGNHFPRRGMGQRPICFPKIPFLS